MLSYTRDFSSDDIEHFWLPFHRITMCRMTFLLRSRNEEIFRIDCSERMDADNHAEIRAYNSKKDELFNRLRQFNDTSNLSVLDFIIALNNSSCTDCRKKIIEWTRDIQQLIPNTSIRLILFFSHLYSDKKPVDSVIGPFSDWILEIVGNEIVVIICPIVVFKMLPEFNYRFQELLRVIRSDENIIEIFRELLKELKSRQSPQNNFFSVYPSDDFFDESDSVYLSFFTWEDPQYISITPRGKEHLGVLFFNFPLTEVSEKISPKPKEIPIIPYSSYTKRRYPFNKYRYNSRGRKQRIFFKRCSKSKLNELKMCLM